MKLLRVLFLFVLAVAVATPALAYDRRTPVVAAVAADGPAVVNIRTEQIVRRSAPPFFGFSDPFFDRFFQDLAPSRAYQTESLGSGVIIDPRGYVLTNAHVIEKASKIYVALPGHSKELQATLVGMTIEAAGAGEAVLSMPFAVKLAQEGGVMHGGALTSLAGTSVAIAIKGLLPPGTRFATTSLATRFLAPVTEGRVTAHAKVEGPRGRTLDGVALLTAADGTEVVRFDCTFRVARGQGRED
ncbi:MAG TPA: hotdog fold thioesterase [Desulfuromonadales bacterium]|nr:hotdog fold thioesterase [Desulfuromonadales bacterium]